MSMCKFIFTHPTQLTESKETYLQVLASEFDILPMKNYRGNINIIMAGAKMVKGSTTAEGVI